MEEMIDKESVVDNCNLAQSHRQAENEGFVGMKNKQ